MKIRFIGLLAVAIFTLIACTPNKPVLQHNDVSDKVEKLLRQMTLEEKIGQMNQYNGFWDVTGPAPEGDSDKEKYEHIKKGWVGSMLNVYGAKNVREMQRLAVENSRLGIPMIFGLDVIHGHKTVMPIPLAETASWDIGAVEKSARIAAIEATAVGQNWTFAPMVDVSRDARWGRVMEGAGEDPYLGSKIGVARVKGFQGNDLSAENTMAACAKHFAGYGFSESGRDYNTVDVGTSVLYNVILPPFKALIDNDVKTVMNSFNTLNGIPATANHFLQRDILKGRWGFKGFVISDWASGKEMIAHGFAKDLEHVAELSVEAGSDMDMESHAYIGYLANLVRSGKVKIQRIDDAVRRILTVKYELGLFDDPYKYCNEEKEKELLYHPLHLEAALDMAKKSMVLLKNENNLLPLDKKIKQIAVIGDLAADKTSPLGNWRIGSEDNTAVSVIEGLKNHGLEFKYAQGPKFVTGKIAFDTEVEFNKTDRSGLKEALVLARNSDVVIMVLGEHGLMSGEGRSRVNLDLPGLQQELLEEVYKVNKNIVLVLMNGRPLVLNWAHEHVPAILEAWHLGIQSGNAIAKVLLGEYNPSGKLPMSFPRHVGQLPLYYNHFNTGRPSPGTNVFKSEYRDVENSPLYPFGYGLSYTNFEYSDINIKVVGDRKVEIKVSVLNSGKVYGEEVVQLYLHDKVASVVRPVKELKGFKKIGLEANQSKEIVFTLSEKELGFFNNVGEYIVEPGKFEVMVGTNSVQGVLGEFLLN